MAAVSPEAKERELEAKRRHYRENKAAYIARAQAQRTARIEYVQNLKATSACADCGLSYPPYVMDFDHVRGRKLGNVSRMVVTRTMKRVLEEIEKCDLVCSNCHRVRTHQRRTDQAGSSPARFAT